MRKQKHTVLKRIFAFTLAAAMAVGSNFSVPGTAGTVEAATTYTGTNIESQNRDYTGQGKTTKSYISKTDDGKIMVVQALSDGKTNDVSKIVVEYYDSNYKLQSQKEISMPTGYGLFGGFYEKGSNYYLVVGKDNSQTANSVIQCWQIIKYNKDWSKKETVNVGGGNTSIPFSNGDVSFAECGDYLVIRTCHSTLKTSAGSYEYVQGSATIVLDTTNMKVTDYDMEVSDQEKGFVKNSFAQLVKVDGNNIVSAELTNQDPRGVVLVKYGTDVSTGKFQPTTGTTCKVVSAFKIPTMDDYRIINTSLGGFEDTGSTYLVVGNSSLKVMEGGNSLGPNSTTRNIFVSVVNKSTEKAETKWLTDYAKDTNAYMYDSASTPHMVKLSDGNYMVLWSVLDKTTKKNIVHYQKINASGNTIGTEGEVEGNLSDCVPTVINDKLVWYTWKNDTKNFYEINLSDLTATVIHTGAIEITTFNLKSEITLEKGKSFTLQPTILPVDATNQKIEWSIDPSSVATIDANGTIKAVSAGTATVTGKTTDGSNITRYCIVKVIDETAGIPIDSVILDPTALTVDEGATKTIKATISPSNATESLIWKSNEPTVATVNNSGTVTGVSVGTAEITATTPRGNSTAKCIVTVKAVTHPVTGVTLSKTELTLTIGETEKLTAGVLPSNATNKAVTWSSSKSTVAEVAADGTVTAKTAGETDITVTTVDGGKTASCKVTVSEGTVSVTDVELNQDTLTLVYGETAILEATVLPNNATNKTVSWESDNAQVASVENGKITAKGPGKAVITVKTEDGDKKATCTVTVTKPYDTPDAPTAESKTADSVTLKKQDGCQYSMDGKSWSDNNVFSDLKPATEYTFYVKKPGDGQYYTDSAATSAKIKTEDRKATAITLDQTEVTVEDGTQNVIQLTATLTPEDVTNKTIKWSSNDETVATVDQTGKVTAKTVGTAKITAETQDGSELTATCIITVKVKIIPIENISLNKNQIRLEKGVTDTETLEATVTPDIASNKTVLWKTSDSSIATVTNGKVTAVGAGKATITAYADENAAIKDECSVEVYQKYAAPSAPTKKSATSTSITLNPITGCEYSKDGTTWQTSNVFTDLTADTAYTFYARKVASGYYLTSDKSQGSTIHTAAATVAVTGVLLNSTSKTVTIKSGQTATFTLTATVNPSNATNKKVIWSSNNTTVASVSDGTVTAKKAGTADITVKTADGGYTATCILTVIEETVQPPSGPSQSDPGQSGPSISDPTPTPAYVPNINVTYRTHVQSFGWQDWKQNGQMAGTSGLAKRLESINISVASAESGHKANLGVQYTTHVQSYGWMPWSANGDASGTEGEAKRLEAIKIQLTGADKDNYDIYYRVHAQSYGWLGWAKNGAPAGTAGYAKRLEGIQIVVVKKDQGFDRNMGGISSAYQQPYVALAGTSPVVGGGLTSSLDPQIGGTGAPNVTYRTHVQSIGWQGWKFNGQMSGTSGQAKRLEGIEIKLTNQPYPGDILYTTHVQSYGWQGDVKNPLTWRRNGVMAGTSGQAKRLEAICITLTGEMAEHYDIYYRVHAQSFGWLGWAKNGAPAGTAGYAKRLEGINIVLVPKGGSAPGSTVRSYVEK